MHLSPGIRLWKREKRDRGDGGDMRIKRRWRKGRRYCIKGDMLERILGIVEIWEDMSSNSEGGK